MRNTQLKVVIADSNLQERESKQLSMEARGMKVILSTGDGNKVLKVINDGKADIVVMDMVLSGVDGIGILEESRNICEKKPIIIIQTALRMENLVEQAIKFGADYYMMKPVSNQMLINRVMQLVSKRYTRESEGSLGNIFRKNAREYEPARAINNVCSGNLELDVTNLLLEIGIPAHIKGYQYIREGIMLSFYDKNMLHYITKCLYPTIAKKYKTTSSSVERTIRHAIEVAFRRGNRQVLEEIFSNTICSKKTKPTNSEFIALLTDKLRLEYRTRNAS
ncbi:MAG: sporulation transcription factor Spo0A [Butyribacter sp.]|jgi:two-component system response regulator (stage 0 sporulation protein A)|uniref:sporulation transcription factor Spo0A n=1 Tax=Clostridia TaxID=186801 RepID=UPI00033D9AA4|nr:sporulation transcription factor Spo0A [Clostridium sp. AM27-31LB]MBS5363260.1 sporulation transcription factor Spo0A [Clostridium sp.]MCQ5164411.1 sporulation transcription factor Spo0A [Roseburia hominis]OKZ80032.1 MAG: sporulation transcription factor Spo0A [Clostridium sp. CAG:12237_41]CCZ42625.1 putative uncharacterized protein [Clostridium sp. CAG:122]RHT96133.1 sporulation transcription factor Spo0A [Clostridium sp. AM27-31LB]